jgi:ribose transport system permease protein
VFWLQPRTMSYLGLNLLFNLAVPIALATIAQMLIIAINDLDLSIGTFVSFVACVTATFLRDDPLVGVLILLAAIGVYALVGALIYLRNLPSIVVTLGMSFVWGGLAVLLLPAPGGSAPDWVRAVMTVRPPLRAHGDRRLGDHRARRASDRHALGLRRRPARGGRQRPLGRPRRLVGAAPQAPRPMRWPALFAVLAGMALVGLTTSADANIALRYTLLSIAGVILGGGEFTGGRSRRSAR